MDCPVCGNEAEKGRDRDYGERRQYRCVRCGPFMITGTAAAMLHSRLDVDAAASARLSHAIRMQTSEDDWLLITSANLDDLVSAPLPAIQQQTRNLLSWLAAQLGDDQLGHVELPEDDSLAAIVGTVDDARVTRLLEYLAGQGSIRRSDDGRSLYMTPVGWEQHQPEIAPARPPAEEQAVEGEVVEMTESEIVSTHCNTCGGERRAYRRTTYTVNGSNEDVPWSNTYDILECCGCTNVIVRRNHWFSAWDEIDSHPITGDPVLRRGIRTTYWPARSQRRRPDWIDRLDDEVLRDVMSQVYGALDHGLVTLAAIGTRTLLDRAMFLRIEDPPGGFRGKLDAMLEAGRIGESERDTLSAITDVGNAAAHRGFSPSPRTLMTILDTVENFLQRDFILAEDVNSVREETPPRR